MLLKINLKDKSLPDQLLLLKNSNLMPFRLRIFFRQSLFVHKIMNENFLPEFKLGLQVAVKGYSLRNAEEYVIPGARTIAGSRRLSNILPKFLNQIFKGSIYLKLCDFKNFLLLNLITFFNIYINF